jgi:hypothetical protein
MAAAWSKCWEKGAPSQLEEPESSHAFEELVEEQQLQLLEEKDREEPEKQEKQEKQEEHAWGVLVARPRRGWTDFRGNPKETT